MPKKPTYARVTFKARITLVLLVGGLVLAGCASAPWYTRALDHFGQTYRTRVAATDTDIFFGPTFNLYGQFEHESIWVGLQKESELPHLQLKVQTTLSNGGGHPFQYAENGTKTLDFLNVALSTHDAIQNDLTPIKMTVQRFTVRIPIDLANSAACDNEDFVIQLSGAKKENFDLKLPRAMLQGFLGKVKQSGEEGIEGDCFDQFL